MRKTLSFLSCLFLFALPACGDNGGGETAEETGATGASMTMPTTEPTTDAPTGGGTPSCADYCADITANCTAANGQYFDNMDGGMAACMTSCAGFDVGAGTDTSGNTLGCRAYHAGAAMGDPATHCTHAGPGGDTACGMNCEGFCAVAMSVCGSTYADEAACMTECATFDATVKYNTTVTSGNNFACRLYHLTAAATDAATHCPHITAASAPCV
jgi:hypothetical protein